MAAAWSRTGGGEQSPSESHMRARGRGHARRFLASAVRRVSRCSYAVRAARPAGHRGPRAGTCTSRHHPAIPRVDSHPRPRQHGRPRPRPHLCPHSHPPLAPSACTHARGSSEWVHDPAVVAGGGGASGGGRLSPRRLLVGREELRRTQPGTARCAAERSGGAAGGCSGLWAARADQRQMGALITETARTDAPLTRTRHAWVVRRLERGSTGHAAPYLLTGIAHLR